MAETIYPVNINARRWSARLSEHARQIAAALVTAGVSFSVEYMRIGDAQCWAFERT